jgi:hypothetical protein
MSELYGIEFVTEGLFGAIRPKWTIEIDVELILSVIQPYLGAGVANVEVTFLAEGCLNKIYKVKAGSSMYAMRVAMPIHAPWKVESEVASALLVAQAVSSHGQ